ncbi:MULTISPECIES: peptidoglycan-binding domain-containing protein [unclassified Streptomyces]|uniref:peptidoglycan-binding domain-containing protein n=1 Tax=unclassified Streptomyces TaxID=2593676 RepID=UPI0004C0D082|nr:MULTISPECIES: peptidoglycan-binding domain-containing protein [unclassified Streptomyces]
MSTPSEPRQPQEDPALEPIRVLRPRRTDALAELMREFREQTGSAPDGSAPDGPAPGGYESVTPGRPPTGSEELTQEIPPLTRETRDRRGPGAGLRWAAVALAVVAAAVLGFGGALLLPGKSTGDKAIPAPSPTTSTSAPAPRPTTSTSAPAPRPTTSAPAQAVTPTPPAADPDGPGTLREGASGPEVTELQERLLRIPDVYRDGSTSGSYDPTLTAAVARFQLWYGIRGDETGVYGNDTRAALESRTAAGNG